MSTHVGFRPDVQGLRALAVVAVVAYHAGRLPGGFVGVDVFFVISGFVIGRLLLRELAGTGRVGLRRFYARRARRLLPALAVLLTAVSLATGQLVGLTSQQAAWSTARAAALFHANLHLAALPGAGYFGPSAERNPLLHTWSLSIEEQFYFVLPVLLLAAWTFGSRWSAGRRTAIGVLVVAGVVSMFFSWSQTYGLEADATLAFFSPVTRAWEFIAGVLVAAFEGRLQRLGSRAAAALALAGWAGLASALWMLDHTWAFPGLTAAWPATATAALIAAGCSQAGRSSVLLGPLSARGAVKVGDLSYSWYLWHWPLIVFAGSMFPNLAWGPEVAAALSIVLAWLSYRFVEQPLRPQAGAPKSARRPASRSASGGVSGVPVVRPGLVTAAVVVVGLTVPYTVASAAAGPERSTSLWEEPLLAPFRFHEDYLVGCDDRGRETLPLEECTWPAEPPSSGTMMLVGDSHAGHLSEAFIAAARRLGFDAVVRTKSSCALVDAGIERDGSPDPECELFYTRIMREARELDAAVVLVGAYHHGYLGSDYVFYDDQVRISQEEKSGWWVGALAGTAEDLRLEGSEPVLFLPTPRFETGWRAAELAPWRLARPPETFAPSALRSDALARSENATTAVARAAEISGSTRLDLWGALCPGEVCSSFAGGRWLYRDDHHLSVDSAEVVTEAVEEALREALALRNR